MIQSDRVSVGDIARAAKLSRTAVAFALQNRPGVSAETQQRVLKIAKQLGYSPDGRIAQWMAQVRATKNKDLLPVAWLNATAERDSWRKYQFLLPAFEGARERCRELGYYLEELWIQEPGMTVRRLSRILYERGIEGIIVTAPTRHIKLDWEHLASVALGSALLAPRLHRVTADMHANLLLAVKNLRRLGYRRIGICLTEQVDRFSGHPIRTTVGYLYSETPAADRVKPLFHPIDMPDDDTKAKQIASWVKRYRPEVVIGHDNRLVEWIRAAGLLVPDEVAVVHLAVDDDVLDWAGIHSNRREAGIAAAEWVIAQMRNRQFGVPKIARNLLIQGSWQSGSTLLPSTKSRVER